MSRVGKKPISIPKGVTVTAEGSRVKVVGPLGEVVRDFMTDRVSIAVAPGEVTVSAEPSTKAENALWGTVAAHIRNMIAGVVKAYEKKLLIEGIGYKWDVKGKDLNLSVGFSHPVKMSIPAGLTVSVDNKGVLAVSGINKDLVGEFTAAIRAQKKPEPYKGKGIRYEGEVIRRKQGKKSV